MRQFHINSPIKLLLKSGLLGLPTEVAEPFLLSGSLVPVLSGNEADELAAIEQQKALTEELTAANATLQEQLAALQAEVAGKLKKIAAGEESRLQAEQAAKAAAEAQISAEAEVARLQAELKAATAKAPAKTDSKPK
ncbi:hypothetical protein [Rheinheimera baltica]|uniref:hypothetical protein n=1 Tax=Rheinheimera baltica TaxID=67576 RepID=UPI000400299F|nr:hypothetical protein [Rheinheimera baltica]